MYYTKIVVNGETYEVSHQYNTKELRSLLKYSMAKIVSFKYLSQTLQSFDRIISQDSKRCILLYQNNVLVAYILGSVVEKDFKAYYFCWNDTYKSYSSGAFRALTNELFKKLNKEGLRYFLIPTLKHRRRANTFFNLLKRVFPEGELDPNLDTEDIKYLKLNLPKIV